MGEKHILVLVFVLCLFILNSEAKQTQTEIDVALYRQAILTKAVNDNVNTLLFIADHNEKINAYGESLAICASQARPILKKLHQLNTPQGDHLYAELLLWMARGDETPRNRRSERNYEIDLMPFDEVGELAAELLDHEDPFVRGFADFAISVAVGMQNVGLREVWPTNDVPGWYTKWIETLSSDFQIESDYVRQCYMRGDHRTCDTLLQSARLYANRIDFLIQEYENSDQLQNAIEEYQTKIHPRVSPG
jgi:hypothetical protein